MQRVYLDNNATSPLDPRVARVMQETDSRLIGNPSSPHSFGREARRAVEDARSRLAKILNVEEREIVFTSSASEANNLAIFGTGAAVSSGRFVASKIEHPCVVGPLSVFARRGFGVEWMDVGTDGRVVVESADRLLATSNSGESLPLLLTLMYANNETGILQPIDEMSTLCRRYGVPLHVDAVQGIGKCEIDLKVCPIDLLTLSSHKIHGPRGVGALIVRRPFRISPQILGGGQERERRAGTENVAGICGLVRALELAIEERNSRAQRINELEFHFLAGLAKVWPDARVNSGITTRLPGVLSVCFPGWSNEILLMNLDLRGVAVSVGSACSSGAVEPSRVLRAMHLSDADNLSSLRFSFSAMNTISEVAFTLDVLLDIRSRVSPQRS